MKQKLLETLDYPCDYVNTGMGLSNCTHRGHFDKNDKTCALCDTVEECMWLQQDDEFASNVEKSPEDLLQSLLFPLDYIDMQLARTGHNVGLCSCDACSWLRHTEALVSRYRKA